MSEMFNRCHILKLDKHALTLIFKHCQGSFPESCCRVSCSTSHQCRSHVLYMFSAHINLICWRKVICPPVEQREWRVIGSVRLLWALTQACGQVSQPVSIKTIINSVRDVSGILHVLYCHTKSPLTTILLCAQQQCWLVFHNLAIISLTHWHGTGHDITPARHVTRCFLNMSVKSTLSREQGCNPST